jgi:hypothetical protein
MYNTSGPVSDGTDASLKSDFGALIETIEICSSNIFPLMDPRVPVASQHAAFAGMERGSCQGLLNGSAPHVLDTGYVHGPQVESLQVSPALGWRWNKSRIDPEPEQCSDQQDDVDRGLIQHGHPIY